MTTADALLAAVIANPADDLPRLVYADWCEENGEVERAEFIRLQIGRANGTATAEDHIREKVMLHAHADRWLAPLRRPGGPLGTQRSHAVFRRGFVEAVWLPAWVYVRTADLLFASCPVDELRVIFSSPGEFHLLREFKQFGRVRALDVCDSRFGAIGVWWIRESEHFDRLRVLRLPGCNLGRQAADLLCTAPLTLDSLDVRHNPLTADGRDALRARFGDAVVFD